MKIPVPERNPNEAGDGQPCGDIRNADVLWTVQTAVSLAALPLGLVT